MENLERKGIMAKRMVKIAPAQTQTQPKKPNKLFMTNKQFTSMRSMVSNEMLTLHREVLNRLLSTQTDIDTACGYPLTLTINDYKTMFERMGLAKRAVQIWPEECWQSAPRVYETEDPDITSFEKEWKEMETKLSVFSYLYRADILSGIGEFGVLLLGLDDGKTLNRPVAGINPATGETTKRAKKSRLLYLRVFDQSVVTVDSVEADVSSPRYGKPKMYSIRTTSQQFKGGALSHKVHWTRVIHIADNRESSESYGTPRMQALYNNLWDIKKVSGGSGEMFWRGGFPGYAFELTPEATAMGAEIDAESVKEQMLLWSQGLQRWLALTGVTTKSLTPQVADPTGHVEIHLKLVALALGVPYRVLLGSEEAKLASVQDKRTWNNRLARRQNNYLTPLLIRPFVDRLVAIGCLSEPKEYFVVWPDLNAATDDDVAKVALNRTDAFQKYVMGNVAALVPPREYLTRIHKLPPEEVEAILKGQGEMELEIEPEPEKPSEPSKE